jgi:hypothetical protein
MNLGRGHGREPGFHHNTLFYAIGLSVVIFLLLTTTGCMSQRAYERVKAETEELSRSLIMAREEVAVLSQSVASLETANKEEENMMEELRVVIQREVELLPLMRQQAYERMVSLQAQIATLADQSRALARHLATARRERDSLKALVSQYRQEVEAARASQPSLPATATPAVFDTPEITRQETTSLESIPPPVTMPQEMAQQRPVVPTEQAASPAPSSLPARPAEESWMDLIVRWLASLWHWILGLFG